MKRSVLFTVSIMLVGMLPTVARLQAQDLLSAEMEIRSLEARRFQALTKADFPALENLISADLVYTHATGWRQNKAEFLASLRTGELQYRAITPHQVKVRIYGSTAVVTGTASFKAKAKGQEVSVELEYLEVFAKQDGRWQLVAWQSTRQAP
ncbi:MAG: nuclear transport factor 2 family protein [Terriglobia bacterium]